MLQPLDITASVAIRANIAITYIIAIRTNIAITCIIAIAAIIVILPSSVQSPA